MVLGQEEIKIRRATLQDAHDLQRNCFGQSTLAAVIAALNADIAAMELGQELRLVAERNSEVVGHIGLRREPHTLQQHIGVIHTMVVCETLQRRGIGRQLMDCACNEAIQLGCTVVILSVRGGTPAETVYHRLGFCEYGRLPQGLKEPWGEQRVYDHVFLWRPLHGETICS